MRESDIRPDEYSKKIRQLAVQDKKRLMKKKDHFVHVICPACHQDCYTYTFKKLNIQYLECQNCKTIYASPRPTAEMLNDYYLHSQNYQFWCEHVFPASEETRRDHIVIPRVDQIEQYSNSLNIKKDVFIEIGAGFGTLCQEVQKKSLFKKTIAIEPSPSLAEKCRERGIEVIEQTIELIDTSAINADAIASFETIEHVFDPQEFILSCSSLLNTNGLLFLSCPNMMGLDTIILREKSKSVGGEHINMFNPESLEILLSRCGFKIIDIFTPGKLDAELVRKSVLNGDYDLDDQRFLKHILIDRWNELCEPFQEFLAHNNLSSHMVAVAQKKDREENRHVSTQ